VTRAIPDPGFAGDDGAADALAGALAGRAEGRTTDAEVLTALSGARLLVPVVALLVEEEAVRDPGLRREKDTDMALVTLTGADGRRALPAFTSLDALARWNPEARPVAVIATRAAQAALAEDAALIALDPAGPVTYLVEGRALRALADGRRLLPPLEDPDIAAAVRRATEPEDGLAGARLVPGRHADATVALVLAADTQPAEAKRIAQRVAGRLAQDETLRSRLDRGLELAVLPAGSAAADDFPP